MKKKRIKYSELASPAVPDAEGQHSAVTPMPTGFVTPEPGTAAPRARRDSTPVELARALAAASTTNETSAPSPHVTLVGLPAPRRSEADAGLRQHVQPEGRWRDRARGRRGTADLLMFRVGAEHFAVELRAVDEVIDRPRIHHVPEMPPAMLGVVTVRERLTPVYSPHRALGSPLASRDAVLIFRDGRSGAGVLVDDVDDAITVDLRDLRDPPGARENDAVVVGVIRHEDVWIAILDAEALIAACRNAALLETA